MLPTDPTLEQVQEADSNDRTQLRGAELVKRRAVGAALAPNVLKSRFVLEQQLGSGGMGTVYLAKDLRRVEAQDRNPHLAIKILNADFRVHPDAFVALQREAAKSQSLSHRNIVKIFDFDKDGDLPFITMELLRGNELSELLLQYPQGLPDSLAWTVIENLCAALTHAHAEGVIHADLKPGNLFVTHAGQLKIFDFGLARAVQANFSQGVMQTRSDVGDMVFDAAALGALTPAFASKATLHGNAPNAADDVFAAALVIYQILTGKHPYNRIPADKIDSRAVALERPRQLSSRQWRALSSALALEEADRVASIADLQSGLFEQSQWPMRLLVTCLVCIATTFWFFNLQKDDEIRVAQEQAVQAEHVGRVEAGLNRVTELIEMRAFDAAWEQRIDDELSRLARLRESASLHADASAKVAALYEARVLTTSDIAEALALAERGERYGSMGSAWQLLGERLQQQLEQELTNTLSGDAREESWVSNIESVLDSISLIADRSNRVTSRHDAMIAILEVNSSYLVWLKSAPVADVKSYEERLFSILERREFDMERVENVRSAVDSRTEIFAKKLERDRAQMNVASFGEEFVEKGCPVQELDGMRAEYAALLAGEGVSESGLVAQADRLLAACVNRLNRTDPAAAASLQRASTNVFGALPLTATVRIDPCDRQYLVGAGARGGLAGTCVDDVRGAPEMVVVTVKNSRLAVSRYEISGAEYQEYCKQTNRAGCDIGEAANPIVNISVQDVYSYASWLSAVTGFNYRLPTREEWLAFVSIADAVPDANRNCRVDVGGVSRGGKPVRTTLGTPNGLGVVNALGNVAEWVESADGLYSVGGHFDNTLDQCIAPTRVPSLGEPAITQGVRLVRELTRGTSGGNR